MPNVLIATVLRDALSNRSRAALVVLSIAIGVLAVGTIAGAAIILQRELGRTIAGVNPAQLMFDTAPLTAQDQATIAALPGVQEVETRMRLALSVAGEGGRPRNLTLLGLPADGVPRINRIAVQDAPLPPPTGEVLVERASLRYLAVTPGDTLRITSGDGRTAELRVAGVAHDPWQQSADIVQAGFGYADPATLQALGGGAPTMLLITAATADHAALERLADDVQATLEAQGVAVRARLVLPAGEHPAAGLVQGVLLLLALLATLALLLSAALVANTMSALLAGQQRQIGVLKAIGASTAQIAARYGATVAVFGGLALLIALPLAALGAAGLSHLLAGMLNADLYDAGLPFAVVGLLIALSVIAPLVAAAPAIRRGAMVSVRAALESDGGRPVGHGQGRLAGIVESAVAGSGVGTLGLAFRAAVRRPMRMLITLATLSVVSGLAISILGVQAMMERSQAEITQMFAFDVSADLEHAAPISLLQHAAAATPQVARLEPLTLVGGQFADGIDRQTIALWGVAPSTATVRPTLLEGRWLQDNDSDAVVITTYVQRARPDLRVGEMLVVAVRGRTLPLRVVGLIAGAPNSVRPTSFAYVPQAFLAEQLGEAGMANRVEVITHDQSPAGQQLAAQTLTAELRRADIAVPFFITGSDLADGFGSVFSILSGILLLVGAMIALVGSLGLAGTLSLGVLERSREIGVLRAVGATSATIVRLVLAEGLLLGLAGWAIGVLIGLPLSLILGTALGETLIGRPFADSAAPEAALLWLALLLPLTLLAALTPALRAARIPVRDVVAYR